MPPLQEWKRGWPLVLGAAIGGGTGASLLFYVSSLFILPITQEFGATRGEMASVQALVGLGAFASPLLGWLTDRWGGRRIFAICMVITAATHIMVATLVSALWGYAVAAALLGMFGIGTGPLVYTRLVNGWFDRQRGLALGVAALGLSITAIIVPPVLAWLIETYGWRSGYLALAAIALLIGLPSVLALTRDSPPGGRADAGAVARTEAGGPRHFLKTLDFWKFTIALILMAIPGAGFISQMSPLVQEEGANVTTAALAVSAYAFGQIGGRIISGAMLDRYNPQWVAFLFTGIPAIGFGVLAFVTGSLGLALFAAAMIGIQQGSETDLFAYFVSRRYGLHNYGLVYGALLGMGWVGNVIGVLGFGWSHDATGSYAFAEVFGAASLLVAAAIIATVRIGHHDPDIQTRLADV